MTAFTSIETDNGRKVDILKNALGDESLAVRLVAIEEIGMLGRDGEAAAEKLYELTENDEEREVALEVLAEMRIRSVPLLTRALKNPDPYVRLYAVARLGELREDARDAIPELRTLLEDENDLVKRAARRAVRAAAVLRDHFSR